MDAIVKKSLGAPVRQLSSCVSGVKDGMGRKGKSVRRKSAPCCYSQTAHDSSWIRAYQAELHRERKLRQVMLSKKNAERAAMRTHYRSPHRYTKTSQDRTQLKTKAPQKNDDSLFGAFQGLSLNMGGTQASLPAPPSAEQCKVM
ncbi:complexin-3 [Colossoma macropomum]|uniref:complexin-3 n=1 Tax=Colossoma macropomum TaxID=42526 RepID=UPI0018656248|nr:complexin-3 [Colossoma macropomum]